MQQWFKWGLVVPALALVAACGPQKEEPKCTGGQTECAGTCTDTQTDNAHCGACGTACGTGTACVAGACAATCGDGVKADVEACDDGNDDAGDGCDASCAIENGWSCQGSPSTCTTGCGDEVIAGMEICDDGNTDDGDGCSAACGVEEGFTCEGEPSACATTCGDSIVAGDETCDDGNTDAGDGCSDTCATETGYICSGTPSTCTTTCGDGVAAGTEVCDDGDLDNGDGCSDLCQVEAGFDCSGAPSTCTTTCGDSITAGAETCDDGNTDAGDGCSDTCAVESGYACNGAPSTCTVVCGDGMIVAAETCDDGNVAVGDGCDATCQLEGGFTCTGEPSVCATTCGDGILAGVEACDDGNADAGDGCSDTCAEEQGFTCFGVPSTCSPLCGDGVVVGGEACDDNNTIAGDGCSDTCTLEAGYNCTGTPSTCATTCGDGVIAGAETCDDGDADSGDGCSDQCAQELGYSCTGAPSACVAQLVCPTGSTLIGVQATDLPQVVSGSSPASSVVTIASGGVVTDVAVGLTMPHEYDGDVSMTLTDPAGTSIDLSIENGGSDMDYLDTWFKDSASTSITAGNAPFTGDFKPEQPLSTFYGALANGNWTLSVTDAYSSDDGSLDEFTLLMCVCTNCEIGVACSDTVDNDGDSQVDCSDPDCATDAACATCGDGLLANNEACDDGNTTPGDGCDATCAVEFGWTCSGFPSACTAHAFTCPSGSTAQLYSATDLPQPVTDGSPASSSIAVSSGGVVTAVSVGLDMDHTYDGDVTLSLDAPGGSVTLSYENGSFEDNYTDTWFDDAATDSITSGSAPFTGTFQPETPLGSLYGTSANGTWTLTASDAYSGGDGTVKGFAVIVCSCTNCEIGVACTDGIDNDGNGDMDCSDTACAAEPACLCGDGVLDPGETCDDGNNTSGDGCGATCTPDPGYSCTGAPSVCAPAITCPTGSTFMAFAATDLPKFFTDTASTSSVIPVSASGTVADAAVRMNVDHNYTGDVQLSLIAPDGMTTVLLTSEEGGGGDDFVDTLFTDGAVDPISSGSPPFTGSFQPESPFTALATQSITGDWTLLAEDLYGGIDGTVDRFELMLCVSP